MTSSSWNQFINQFLLEFGWIDWKVDLSMLQSIEKKKYKWKIWKLETTRSQKVSYSTCLLKAQFTFKVRIKWFILTTDFQNGFFRQTKCKLLRVPNITNYCSSYKILSSLKLFLDLARMLQQNDFFSLASTDIFVAVSNDEVWQDKGKQKQENEQT